MYPEKKGGSYKMARPQQNWSLLTLLTRWASIWTMPNTASPKSEPPCGRAVYTPVRATILGHPPQKTAPRGVCASSILHQSMKIFATSKKLIFSVPSIWHQTNECFGSRNPVLHYHMCAIWNARVHTVTMPQETKSTKINLWVKKS